MESRIQTVEGDLPDQTQVEKDLTEKAEQPQKPEKPAEAVTASGHVPPATIGKNFRDTIISLVAGDDESVKNLLLQDDFTLAAFYLATKITPDYADLNLSYYTGCHAEPILSVDNFKDKLTKDTIVQVFGNDFDDMIGADATEFVLNMPELGILEQRQLKGNHKIDIETFILGMLPEYKGIMAVAVDKAMNYGLKLNAITTQRTYFKPPADCNHEEGAKQVISNHNRNIDTRGIIIPSPICLEAALELGYDADAAQACLGNLHSVQKDYRRKWHVDSISAQDTAGLAAAKKNVKIEVEVDEEDKEKTESIYTPEQLDRLFKIGKKVFRNAVYKVIERSGTDCSIYLSLDDALKDESYTSGLLYPMFSISVSNDKSKADIRYSTGISKELLVKMFGEKLEPLTKQVQQPGVFINYMQETNLIRNSIEPGELTPEIVALGVNPEYKPFMAAVIQMAREANVNFPQISTLDEVNKFIIPSYIYVKAAKEYGFEKHWVEAMKQYEDVKKELRGKA